MIISQLEDDKSEPTHVESIKPNLEALESEDQKFEWNFSIISSIFSLCMMLMMSAWGSLIPLSAVAFIAERFPDEANNVAWIATASSISVAAFTSFIGDLSDIFNRRAFLLFGCSVNGIGLVVGGRATSLNMVIGGQVLNGMGLSFATLALPLIFEIVPKKNRAIVSATAAIFGSSSFILAPILEGVFIQEDLGGPIDGWRIGFYLAAGWNVLTAAALLAFYHPMPRPNPEGLSVGTRIAQIDWLGIILGSGGLALFLFGMNVGDNPYPWGSATVIGPLIAGFVMLTAFGIWEWKGTDTGILPKALWQDRNYAITLCVRVVGGFALIGSQSFLPQVLVYVFGTGGLMTAVWQLPFSLAVMIGNWVAAGILHGFKEVKWITIGLLLLLDLGAGLMILIKSDVSFATWFFPTALMGIAVGSEGAVISVMSGLVVPNQVIATATCVAGSFTYVGGAVAATMYSQIYNSKIKVELPKAIAKSAAAAGVPASSIPGFLVAYTSGNATALAEIPGVNATILATVADAAKDAYAKSFEYIWCALIAFSTVCVFVCLFFTSTKKYFTAEVAAPIQQRRPRAKNAGA